MWKCVRDLLKQKRRVYVIESFLSISALCIELRNNFSPLEVILRLIVF